MAIASPLLQDRTHGRGRNLKEAGHEAANAFKRKVCCQLYFLDDKEIKQVPEEEEEVTGSGELSAGDKLLAPGTCPIYTSPFLPRRISCAVSL